MQKVKNLRGLSLGAVVSLVGSLFFSVPAAIANENAVVISPDGGTAAQTSMLHTEPYEFFVRYGSAVTNVDDAYSFRYSVSSSSPGVRVELSHDGSTWTRIASSSPTISAGVGEIRDVVTSSDYIRFSLTGTDSQSSAVSITVTPFINKDGDPALTAADLVGNQFTINFVPWSTLGATMTFTAPQAGNVGITASGTVTAGTINWSQLDGVFTVGFNGTFEVETNGDTYSAGVSATGMANSYELTGKEMEEKANFSYSARVVTAPASGSPVASYSAQLFYAASSLGGANPATDPTATRGLLPRSTVGVSATTITNVTISPVAGSNILQDGAGTAKARINSTFTLNAYPHSTSVTTSMAVASSVTVSAVGNNIEFGPAAGVTFNGVNYSSSEALLAAGFTQAAGTTTMSMATYGQDNDGTSETIELRITSQLQSTTLTITVMSPTFTVEYEPTDVASGPGGSRTFALEVEDNFGVLSARTDQRVAASVVLSGSTSETVSAAVVNGAASVTLAPVPATRTGSGVVTFTLQTLNQDTGVWVNGDTDTATWNVSALADSFVSRTATASSSISYGVAYSYSGTINVKVTNSGSDVVVSAPGLIIQNADRTSQTASGTLTIAATGQNVNVKFAGTKAGTATVTFTNGTASTTSLVTFDAAPSNKGASITWDTTTIEAGKTKVITGTLLDANGNPVDTTRAGEVAGDSGTASLVVTYTGTAGIVVGNTPTETDADGKFRVSVLTAAADSGTMTLTAVYMPEGASTVAANKVTSVQAVTVAPAAAPEVNAVIGSFLGRWAVRVENAKGSTVAVKVGGNWYKYTALNDNYLFSRKSRVGATVAVSVWVDGELQNSQTITVR